MQKIRWAGTVACAAGFLGILSPSAHADMTVVTERTVSGETKRIFATSGNLSKALTIEVSYSKGNLSRVDADGKIILRGLEAGTITVLDPATRTYYVTTEMEEIARQVSADSPFPEGMNLTVNGGATPGTATRTILGQTTNQLHYSLALNLHNPQAGADDVKTIKVVMSGDMWIAPKQEPIVGGISAREFNLFNDTQFSKTVTEMLQNIHGVALQDEMSINIEVSDDAPAEIKSQLPKGLKVREDIVSISHDKLPAEVFAIPDYYKEVIPPMHTGAAKPTETPKPETPATP